MSHKYRCFQSHYKPRIGGGREGEGRGGEVVGREEGRIVSSKY